MLPLIAAVQPCRRPPRHPGQLRAPAPSQQVSHIWGAGSPNAGKRRQREHSAWNSGMAQAESRGQLLPPVTLHHPSAAKHTKPPTISLLIHLSKNLSPSLWTWR